VTVYLYVVAIMWGFIGLANIAACYVFEEQKQKTAAAISCVICLAVATMAISSLLGQTAEIYVVFTAGMFAVFNLIIATLDYFKRKSNIVGVVVNFTMSIWALPCNF